MVENSYTNILMISLSLENLFLSLDRRDLFTYSSHLILREVLAEVDRRLDGILFSCH